MRARHDRSESEALQYISTLIYERSRIRLDAGKHALIKARLGKRMRHHGYGSLPDYCDFLQSGADENEITCVVDALTTNFTNFLREPDHFDFLIDTALPAFASSGERQLRVWSAACSSGEEPYTISFYLANSGVNYPALNWAVTASDISTKVLDKARKGIYSEDRVSVLPRDLLSRYFQKGVGAWTGYYKVKRELSDKVSFRQINLVEDYSHPAAYQVIFCRNVMIYFDRATQEQLVRRMCGHLVPGGYVIIGHSESLNGLRVPLRCLRPSIYQKA